MHEGVATCGGSTCHGRLVPSGKIVRQNEISTWQDISSPAGAHSRAWQVLSEPRGESIARRLGMGPAEKAPACLGCHSEYVPAALRGPRFQVSDSIGCEACHGASSNWLGAHYAVNASHERSVSLGMIALEDPKVRAGVCLDCHFGSEKPGYFVSHRIMSAGHPRVSFELELFSALQRHYDIDADYAKRKKVASGVKIWAVGQAMALDRTLTLYSSRLGQNGMFPELYFFDCQSCHRRISDDPNARPTAQANPDRDIQSGTPAYDDENIIMLEAAVKVAAPQLATRFIGDSRSFHAAMADGRGSAVAAAQRLAATARTLADAFSAATFSREETRSILLNVLSGATAARFTDYAGGAQAVMAADTLLNSLVAAKDLDPKEAERLRPQLNHLYDEVRDANSYHPGEFRVAVQGLATAVRNLPWRQ